MHRLLTSIALRAIALLVVLSTSGRVLAQTSNLEGCQAENMLAGARVIGGVAQTDSVKVLFDRIATREGAPWPRDGVALVLRQPIAFDLGTTRPLQQLYLQVDADQSFALELSRTGDDWTKLPVAASTTTSGLVSRTFNLGSAEARFVRIVPTSEPPTLVVTELALSCRRDVKLRRGLTLDGPPRPPLGASWFPGLLTALTGVPAISPAGASALKLGIVALGLWLLWLERRGRRYALGWALLGAAAIGAYLNLGSYRYPEFVHDHDVFHYFVGAKYFPELGYDRLYACSAVAEAEAGFEQRVRLRAQRDLRTNQLVSGGGVLGEGAACRTRFGSERWREFRRDVAYFADGRSVEDWHRVLKDHGFNASPTWIALARVLTADLPATETTIGHRNAVFAGDIGPLDPLLALLALASVYWAFGARTAALVAVVFGCNPLSEFAWVGGGFLREAWLASLVIGISLVKKQRLFSGGMCLALAALLQLFPLASLALPLLGGAAVAMAQTSRGRWPPPDGFASWAKRVLRAWSADRSLWRLLAGAALTLLVLTPVSSWVTQGERPWVAFAANTAKHEATPSGNLVGLGSLLSFRPSTNVDALFDATAADPFARARAARLAARHRMRPIQGLIVLSVVACLALGLRERKELWWTCALGLCLVPLALETSCYYAAWLSALALVGHGHERLKVPILATLAALLVAKLAIARLGVDMAVASAILLLGIAALLVLALRAEPAAAPPAP